MHNISITAHSGALNTEPNTLESIKAALAFGAEIIEVDVRFRPDGTPVLGHGRAAAHSPALEAVFELLQGCDTRINLDMKETAHAEKVAQLVAQYGLQGRAFMTGIMKRNVPAAKNCGLPYYLNSADTAAARALGALGPNISYLMCTKALIRAAREQGLLVSVWTVDKRPAMEKMLRMGVDNITTRKPDVLRELMRDDH